MSEKPSTQPAPPDPIAELVETNKALLKRVEELEIRTEKTLKKHARELRDRRVAQEASTGPEGAPGPAPKAVDAEAEASAARDVIDYSRSLPAEARERFEEQTQGMSLAEKAKSVALLRQFQPQAAPIDVKSESPANGNGQPPPANGRGMPPARVSMVRHPRDQMEFAKLSRPERDALEQDTSFNYESLPAALRG